MRTIQFLALMLFGAFGFSQTTISGTVVDENNQPIPAANIVIVGTTIGTTADFDGNFVLETSEVPPFQLIISSLGFSEARENITAAKQTRHRPF